MQCIHLSIVLVCLLACGTAVCICELYICTEYLFKVRKNIQNWTITRKCYSLSLAEVRVCCGQQVSKVSVTTSLPSVIMMSASGSTSEVCSWDMPANDLGLWSFRLGGNALWHTEVSTRRRGVCYDACVTAIFISMASWHARWGVHLGAQHLEWKKKQIPLT